MESMSKNAPALSLRSDTESHNTETWKPRRAEYLVMITLSLISLMVALDATILVPVLPTLALALDGSSTDAFWAGTSYLLTSAVFQPFIVALSDVFGRQQLLLVSLICFSLGTTLCSIANDFTIFLAGRSIQGIGGGGIITMTQVIFSDMIPLRQRPKYFAMVLGAWAVGSILGPVTGGFFVQYLTWRWVFYFNFPFCAAGFVMIPLFVKLNAISDSSLTQKIRRIDWLGSLLFLGSTTSFLIGISWAGVQYAWLSVQSLMPIIIGTLGIGVSLYWETIATQPILRLALFNNVSAMAAYYCAFAQGFILFMALYYCPFYFESVRGGTPVDSGVNIFPVVCLLLPSSVVVSVLTTVMGRFRWAIWGGWVLTTLGSGLLLLLDKETKTAVWAGVFAVFGVGNGMVLTSVNIGTQAISEPENCGRAASMYAFIRTLGMSVGVAVGSTAFQNAMSHHLTKLSLPTSIARASESYVSVLRTLPPNSLLRIGVLDSYIRGFRAIFLVMTCVAGSALLISGCIGKFSMDQLLKSDFNLREKKDTETV